MAGKKFKFRAGTDGKSGIKEVVAKSTVFNGKRYDISIGVTNEFDIAPLNIFKENVMTPLGAEKVNRERGKTALYYPIESISYICTVTLVYKGNQIKNKKLTVYIPKYIVSSDELYCERVTGSFSLEEREEIVEKLLLFAKSRI